MMLSCGAAAAGMIALVWILATLFLKGPAGVSLAVFTQMTPPPGSAGGLLNAMFGSLVQTLIATLIGTPVGILAGTYMAEYGRNTRLTSVVRFINDVLLSAPSIVMGLFVSEIMVPTKGLSLPLAGCVAPRPE